MILVGWKKTGIDGWEESGTGGMINAKHITGLIGLKNSDISDMQ